MLKYLFTATFADGSTLKQTMDDRSAIDPEKRSQFYDVLERSKTSPLVRFELTDWSESTAPFHMAHKYAVDLMDGHFEVDGVPFRMHEEELAGFQIIFWRNHTHSFNVRMRVGTAEGTTQSHVSEEIVYRIGWQCNVNGKNHQRVMEIK